MDLDAPEGDVAYDRCILWEQSVLWVFPSVIRGVLKRNLLQKDFPGLPISLSSSGGLAGRASELRSTGLNLSRVIWKLMWVELAVALILGFVQGLLTVVARPLLLKAIIEVTAKSDEEREAERVTLLVVLVGVVVAVEAFCMAGSKHALGERFSSGALTVVIALLHDKCWRIPDSAAKVEVVNMVGSDCVRCLELMKTLCLSPASLTMIIGGIVVIYTTLEPVSASVGLGTICAVLICNAMLSRVAHRAEAENLARADERIRIMEQLITGIRAVKLLAWEENYLHKIRHARMVEGGPMRRFRILTQAQIQIGRSNPIIAACVTFCVFALRGGELEPVSIFAVLNVFLGMRMALVGLPDAMSVLTSISVVAQRIEAYLNLPEVVPTYNMADGPPTEPVVSISRFEASWADGAFQLRIPSFTVLPGQLVAVVGHVASGKSSLLMALLGEIGTSPGVVSLRGTVGYVGQEPFVLADTVRTNIVMGRRYDEELLGEALWKAAFEEDVAKLSMHVDTYIGEHGVSLSGGQQQRLALARALYGKPTLLLCDDPLSALDVPTGEAVFQRGLRPYTVDGRAAVVVLNQDHFLPQCDVAYELEDGIAKLRHLELATSGATSLPAQYESPASFRPFVTVPLDSRPSKNGRFAKEAQVSGVVSLAVTRRYIVGFQGKGKDGPCRYLFFAITIGSTLLTYIVMAATDRWLAYWVNVADAEPGTAPGPYVAVYFAGCVCFILLLHCSSALFAVGGVRSGRELHEDCITRLLHAPLHFFEATPSGRILSRFSADLGSVDLTLSRWFDNLAQTALTLLIILVQIVLILPVVAGPILVSFALYVGVTVAVNPLSREARRLQNAGLAPVQTAIREAEGGRVVVRAMGLGQFLNERLVARSDALTRFFYFGNSVLSWAMLMSYVLGGIITTVAALVAMHWDIARNSSDVGLALTYCFVLPYFLPGISLCSLSLLQTLPSMERLLQYSEGSYVPQEAAWETPVDASWNGVVSGGMEIIFEDVHLSYVTGRLPAIGGASFRFLAGESIGVVGRTGAGKSTLLLLLLRVREPSAGRILLGGYDSQTLGLMALRRSVGVIPQTPLLINGTVRENLDPWGEHSDAEIKAVTQRVRLGAAPSQAGAAQGVVGHKRRLETGGLAVLDEDAGDLSAGEHQLLSLARCLLGKQSLRAVVLDEPTSNIDLETDEVVESVINEDLGHLTMIEIAHRLHDVVDSDRVLVMDKGRAIELGTPVELLANPDSHFTGMARALGPEVIEELQNLASSFAQGSRAAVAEPERSDAGAVHHELVDPGPVLSV